MYGLRYRHRRRPGAGRPPNGPAGVSTLPTGLIASGLAAGGADMADKPGRAVPVPGHAPPPSRRPPRRPRPPRGARGSLVPYLTVLAIVACGLAWVLFRGTHGVRGGTLALAGAMFIAALARLVLPESRAGMLASRSRATEVATFLVLAAGLLAVGLML